MSRRNTDEFLAEAEELLETLSQDLGLLGSAAEQGQSAPDLINQIFRNAHSIKGLAGMFGFSEVAELAHHLETLLDQLRLGKITLDSALIDCLFDTLEVLAALIRGKAVDPDFSLDPSDCLNRIDNLLPGSHQAPAKPGNLGLDSALLDVLTEYEEHRLRENLKQGCSLLLVKVAFSLASFDTELSALIDAIKQRGEVISTLPGVANDNPELLAFRILCGSNLTPEELQQQLGLTDGAVEMVPVSSIADAEQPHDSESGEGPETTGAAEEGQPTQTTASLAAPGQQSAEPGSARSLSSTVRVDIAKLDSLMNIVGELALAKAGIARLSREMREQGVSQGRDLEKALHQLDRRINELQAGVMDVRMVPVGQLFDRMNRIVRRMSQELGKKVTLEVHGGETELDKLIIEDLGDPLMHIIRNAIDHGIEVPQQRQSLAKPAVGRITLRASQRGNHVVIEIADDGCGIDPQLLRRKGIEKGLIAADADLSRAELFGLLFHPGFSTREEISEYSGRGVGMDVVKNNISALSGLIEMDSHLGQGTSISLTLPITLAIIKALVVSAGGRSYAIPISSVQETLLLEAGMLQTIEGREVIDLRGQTLPLMRIDRIFNLGQSPAQEQEFVVVSGFADKRIGLIVNELQGQRDVVIKSLGKALAFVKGIAGAADLGNQRTILVLDVGGLMNDHLQLEGGLHV